MPRIIVVSLSGGMDSATVFAKALQQVDAEVFPIGFTYGSKHNPYELNAASQLALHYQRPFRLIDLRTVGAHLSSNLLKSGGPIPEGHYAAPSMAQTVVPGRNMIFVSILAGIAWSLKKETGSELIAEVWLGIHAGDHAIYPDCRPDFFFAMRNAVRYGTDDAVTMEAPFLYKTKADILRTGLELGVPYQWTRTCYADQEEACGRCGACNERLEAFHSLGYCDPVVYENSVVQPTLPYPYT